MRSAVCSRSVSGLITGEVFFPGVFHCIGSLSLAVKSSRGSRYTTIFLCNTRNRHVDMVGEFAQRKKATPAQIALAWLLAQKPWIVPIPGTTKLHRLEENIGVVDIEVTPAEVRELKTAASKIAVQGARYPEALQNLVVR